ncbi:hypothetical protein CRV08_11155 [Halarcobacter ebronensis]|uniref:Uncharacterized protein n=1 Tax=Halarcobacter ebronensis TaxID=1462615 RepID=A0A4Q0YE06_9BACT|nr:hypothetical protein [Halarcobacter ebronensis]RXJ67141.1 hypothetical protein CRV08_11155 [Halarcobacter ebronensis]
MDSLPLEEPKNKYSYVFKRTFDLIFKKKNELAKVLLIPFILLLICEYFSKAIIMYSNIYIFAFVYIAITVIMSVLIHRIILLNEEVSFTHFLKFFSADLKFFLKTLLLIVFGAIIGGILIFLTKFSERLLYDILDLKGILIYSTLIKIVIFLFIAVLFSRLSLVFPAISIDKPIGFVDAFVISSKYKTFVFLNVIIIPVLLGALVGGVYGIVIGFLMGIISPELSVLSSLVSVFITIFSIGFISVTYEYIMSKNEEEKIVEDDEESEAILV